MFSCSEKSKDSWSFEETSLCGAEEDGAVGNRKSINCRLFMSLILLLIKAVNQQNLYMFVSWSSLKQGWSLRPAVVGVGEGVGVRVWG